MAYNISQTAIAEWRKRMAEEVARKKAMEKGAEKAETVETSNTGEQERYTDVPIPDIENLFNTAVEAFGIDKSKITEDFINDMRSEYEATKTSADDLNIEFDDIDAFNPVTPTSQEIKPSDVDKTEGTSTTTAGYETNSSKGMGIQRDNSSPMGMGQQASGREFSSSPSSTPSPVTSQDNFRDLEADIEFLKKQNRELMKLILNRNKQIQDTQKFTDEIQKSHPEVRQKVQETTQGFEDLPFEPCVSSFCGKPFKYSRYDTPVTFNKKFEQGLTVEGTATNYASICNEVCDDITKKYGGWERITDFAVVSDILIINSISYEPKLPQGYADAMPFDLRLGVQHGHLAWLFDFKHLRKMKNLVNLKFDSADFVYSKVRQDLSVVFDFSCATLFKVCKNLMTLQIGQTVITRADLNHPNYNDIFARCNKAEQLRQKLGASGWSFTGFCWNSIRKAYNDPHKSGLGKVLSVTAGSVGMVGGGAFTLGTKGVGLVGKLGKKIGNIASAIKDNL